MKTLTFQNGDKMPILGLGTWQSQPGEVYTALREAIRAGYRHIDCAAIYGNEVEIGQALRDAMAEGQVTRPELWVTSKLWNNAHGRDNVKPALKKTLGDLCLEYLDLYLIHWPIPLKPEVSLPSSGADFLTLQESPLHLTWAGMEEAVQAGLTRHIGVSNFSVKKISDLLAHCKTKPEVNQVELHPFLQQNTLINYCASQDILVTAYSPLGSPARPASLRSDQEPSLLENEVIQSIAQAHSCTAAQLLLAWSMQRGISVIPKSVKPTRLRENLAAADLTLNPSDLERIAALERSFRFIDGTIWVAQGGPWTVQTVWDEP